ncbi:MAG: hypothetical protein Kow0031_18830 [Anaerolineae bacterium]
MNQLLPLCARLNSDEAHRADLKRAAAAITDWPALLARAERHGLAPLLYRHLRGAGAKLPPQTGHELRGLVLRHRHANRVRGQILAEIYAACRARGIELLLLKGVALAHLIYPQPGLRPMRDVDLLVKPADAAPTQDILGKLGFSAPHNYPAGKASHHHLAAATRQVEGFSVSVEVHHNVFMEESRPSLAWDELTAPPLEFSLPDGTPARTLGGEDTLWHLCHHVASIPEPFRLIWVVDVTAFAEQFVDAVDWARVRRQYPRVLEILSLFHAVTPLSDRLRETAGVRVGHPPRDIGADFNGWPRYAVNWMRRERGLARITRDTLLPPEWWLRLYYGVGTHRSLATTRWLRHPLHIAGFAAQLLRQKTA